MARVPQPPVHILCGGQVEIAYVRLPTLVPIIRYRQWCFSLAATRKQSSKTLGESEEWNYNGLVLKGAAAEESQPRDHGQWTPLARALGATGDRWTLLIAQALADGPQRPVQLRGRLPEISSGVLDRHLQQMVGLGLLLRRRFKEMPPRVELALTEAGRELLPIARALARWGIKHM
jgi:DNA-binding HxlR family transcriptional regulator